MMIDAKIRDSSYDVVKFVAIFMVVFWHVMSYRPGFDPHAMRSYSANFIIVVNMPLFFILSGFFYRRLHESGNVVKLVARLMSYFWPLAFASLLFSCINCCVLGNFSYLEVPLRATKLFLFADWFLKVLAICDIVVFIACKCKRLQSRIIICVVAYVLCLVGTGIVWYVGYAVAMMPFYWFGLWLMPMIVANKRLFRMFAILGMIALFVTTYLCGSVESNGLAFYWNKLDVYQFQWSMVVNMLLRCMIGSIGGLSIIWLVKALLTKVPRLDVLAKLGRETLGIYLFQGGLIEYFSNPFVSMDAGLGTLMTASCIIVAIAALFVKFLKANNLVRRVAFGLTAL